MSFVFEDLHVLTIVLFLLILNFIIFTVMYVLFYGFNLSDAHTILQKTPLKVYSNLKIGKLHFEIRIL